MATCEKVHVTGRDGGEWRSCGSHCRGPWRPTAGSGAASVRAQQKVPEGNDRQTHVLSHTSTHTHTHTHTHTIRPLYDDLNNEVAKIGVFGEEQ